MEEIEMDIKEFAEKYIPAQTDAWQKGDFKLLETLEDHNIVWHGREGGFEGHKQFFTMARQSMAIIKMEWKFIVGEGNLFALSLKGTYKLLKEFPGSKIPVGKAVSVDNMMLLRLKNGKVVEVWEKGSSTILD